MLSKLLKGLLPFGLAVSTAHAALPDASQDINAVKTWAADRISEAEANFASSGYQREPSPGFWGSQVVYEIQTDRFNNGDLSNDNLNNQQRIQDELDGGNWYNLHEYRHGGDIKGIMDRLDYLQDLGVQALWITPVFKNDGAYHGYCVTDFTEVDPAFGTNEQLRELTKEAHKRDIKIILDIVVNHMCDKDSGTGYQDWGLAHDDFNRNECSNELNSKHWSGQSGGSSRQVGMNFSSNFFGPLKSEFFFNRCGVNTGESMQGEEPTTIFGDFVSGMYDFDTRNRDFQQIFTDMHKWWIAYADIDGFRMDAVKHVTEDFIAYFSTHTRAYAQSIGKENFYVVGEVAGSADYIGRRLGNMFSDPTNPDEHGEVAQTTTNMLWDLKDVYATLTEAKPGLTAAYDMGHGGRSREAFLDGKGTGWIASHFNDPNETYYPTIAAQSDPRDNLVHLEIHDWPRFVLNDFGNPWKSRLGVKYITVMQGMPVLYYGQEQGFMGKCRWDNMNTGNADSNARQQEVCSGHDHALYRQDMFDGPYRLQSTVSEINDMAYIGKMTQNGSPHWLEDPFLNRDHFVYQSARQFNYIRQSCDAIRYGYINSDTINTADSDLLIFSKADFESGKEAIVIVNASGQTKTLWSSQTLSFNTHFRYKSLTTGHILFNTDGQLHFDGLQIEGNDVLIFVPETNTSAWSEYLGTHQCNDNPKWPPFFSAENQAPVIDVKIGELQVVDGGTYTFRAANVIELNASGTTDEDSNLVYQWASSGISPTDAHLPTVQNFVDFGESAVTLTVTDSEGLSSTINFVIVGQSNQAPTAILTASSHTVSLGDAVTFDASGSTDPENDALTFTWSDGAETSASVSRTYTTLGSKSITVTVTDELSAQSTATVTVEVVAAPLESTFETVYFRGTANGWATTAMELVSDFTWETVQTFGAGTDERFKFDINGDWTFNFGDTDANGVANQSGADIRINEGAGDYRIRFNDNTKAYTVEKIEVNQAPVANAGPDFSTRETLVTLDASASTDDGTIVEYKWQSSQFGGSKTVFGEVVEVSLPWSEPTATITLTVTDDEGLTSTDTIVITKVENQAPVARLSIDGQQVFNNDTFQVRTGSVVSLDATASSDDATANLTYFWEVPGVSGATGTWTVPAGPTGLLLTVQDEEGLQTDLFFIIEGVANQAPVAAVTQTFYSIFLGDSITFDATPSTDAEGDALTFTWSNGMVGATPTQQFNEVGVFTITLTATDTQDASSTVDITVTVAEGEPEKNFEQIYLRGTANGWGTTALELIADNTWQITATFGSTSNERFKLDIDGDWSHNYGDDGANGSLERTGADIAITEGEGDYIITVNDASMTYTVTKIVGNQAPTIPAMSDINLRPNEVFEFDGSGATDADGTIVSYLWEINGNPFNQAVVEAFFSVAGTYTAKLTVTDDEGATATESFSVIVAANDAPSITPIEDRTVTVGEPVTFTVDATDDRSVVAYEWAIDGSIYSTASATHTFAAVGTYSVAVSVTDDEGASSTETFVVTVIDAPSTIPVTFTCNNAHTTSGTSIYVVGNIPELGPWSIKSAAQKLDPTNYPTWSATLEMPANTEIKWKCVKGNENTLEITQWQGGSDNTVVTGATGSESTSGSF